MTTVSVLLLLGLLALPQAGADDVQTFTLANGMKVLVLEDHSIPNADMFLFFRVGSRNEVPGITGLSHFFEHMMFNGAGKYGPKEFDRVMEAAGGANNAYTSKNLTVYTDFFPSSALEVIFDLEADRIATLALDPEMVESERGVVHSEYTTGMENSNYGLLDTWVTGAAMVAHPYRWSVIGWESDILSWSREDLVKYFATYYAPNNCTAVFVGDVELEEVKRLCGEYFEPITGHDPPRPVHTVEPEQRGEKRLTVYKDVSSPNVLISYHVPETGSPEYYALDLMDTILAEGNSSRLYRKLVDETRLAIAVNTSLSFSFDPYLYSIYAVCARDAKPEDLEQAVYEVIADVADNGITERELQKAKNMKLMQFYHAMETIDGKANTLGTYECFFGDYRKLFSAPEDYNRVTAEDVKNVAAKYLVKRNRTVGYLMAEEEVQ